MKNGTGVMLTACAKCSGRGELSERMHSSISFYATIYCRTCGLLVHGRGMTADEALDSAIQEWTPGQDGSALNSVAREAAVKADPSRKLGRIIGAVLLCLPIVATLATITVAAGAGWQGAVLAVAVFALIVACALGGAALLFPEGG